MRTSEAVKWRDSICIRKKSFTHQLNSKQVKVPEAGYEYSMSQATVTAKAFQVTPPPAVIVYPVVSVGVVQSSAVQPESM